MEWQIWQKYHITISSISNFSSLPDLYIHQPTKTSVHRFKWEKENEQLPEKNCFANVKEKKNETMGGKLDLNHIYSIWGVKLWLMTPVKRYLNSPWVFKILNKNADVYKKKATRDNKAVITASVSQNKKWHWLHNDEEKIRPINLSNNRTYIVFWLDFSV